jgi:prephenate dehydrogenase
MAEHPPVLVVGAGLIGASLGLALRAAEIDVVLRDADPETLRTASGIGAGEPWTEGVEPGLVVVAVPPDLVGPEIVRVLEEFPFAAVTDVGSVKTAPLHHVQEHASPSGLARYVGGHPMAGSERSGPLAASAALFDGRPWAITPHPEARDDVVAGVATLAELCGATVVSLAPEEHDRAVARTSHLPHLMAVLVAGRLAGAPAEHLALSGQGVRDVTRIAAGDPALWQQIIAANSEAVLALLDEVRDRLDVLRGAVAGDERQALGGILEEGVSGTRAIPGKHGGPVRPTRSVFVAVPDHPGELARLFADAGHAGVNIEDIHIDHDPGRPVGQVELVVEEDRADHLVHSLYERGWTLHQ